MLNAGHRKCAGVQAAATSGLPRIGRPGRFDAAQARIAYDTEAGRLEESVLATSTISALGAPVGMEMAFVENVLGFATPASELEAGERLFGAILAAYEEAVRQVIERVHQTQIQGQWAQIQALRSQSR